MKRIPCALILIATFLVCEVQAQAPVSASSAAPPGFEVAVLKPHPPGVRAVTESGCHGADTKYSLSVDVPVILAKPPQGRCVGDNVDLTFLIRTAYSLVNTPASGRHDFKVPEPWMTTMRWSFQGKAEDANASEADLRRMLQRWLADNFKLQFHHETKEVDGFTLVTAKGGSKLVEEHFAVPDKTLMSPGKVSFVNKPMSYFVPFLFGMLGGTGVLAPGSWIEDKTGLEGSYTFELTSPPRESPEDLVMILEKDLGLKLQRGKVSLDIVVIDRAERPPQ